MKSQQDQAEELAHTKRLLAALTDEVERNTQILKRSQERELDLLQSENLQTLFGRMLSGLRTSYGLDAVTVVLCDPDHGVRHLLIAGGASPEDLPGLIFVDAMTGLAPEYASLREPWLGKFAASDHQLIFPGHRGLESAAIIPLTYKGRLLGSINFGSSDPSRFTADHASDFFAHLGVIASFSLENVVNRTRLLRSGFTDVLTGWYNRRYLQLRMKEELARARRHATPLTCLMLDIDHFKRVNDDHGHQAGDAVLREIAHRIESQIRATDVAARYGGEEFVILLPETVADAGAMLAERIRAAIADSAFDIGGDRRISVTASIGIASAAPERTDTELKTAGDALIARADVALYRAKSAGRNCLAVNDDD